MLWSRPGQFVRLEDGIRIEWIKGCDGCFSHDRWVKRRVADGFGEWKVSGFSRNILFATDFTQSFSKIVGAGVATFRIQSHRPGQNRRDLRTTGPVNLFSGVSRI